MKSNFKAIFAIFAVALMLLVAAVPAVGVFTDNSSVASASNGGVTTDIVITVNVKTADGMKLKGYSEVTINGTGVDPIYEGASLKAIAVDGVAIIPAKVKFDTNELKVTVDKEKFIIKDSDGQVYENAAYNMDLPEITLKNVKSDVTVDIISGTQTVSGYLCLKGTSTVIEISDIDISVAGGDVSDVVTESGYFTFCGVPGTTYTITANVVGIEFECEVVATSKAITDLKVEAKDYMVYGTSNICEFGKEFDEKSSVQDLDVRFGDVDASLVYKWYAKPAFKLVDESLSKSVTMTATFGDLSYGIEDVKATGTISVKTVSEEYALSNNAELKINASLMSGTAVVGDFVIGANDATLTYLDEDSSEKQISVCKDEENGLFFVGNKIKVGETVKSVDGYITVESSTAYTFSKVAYKAGSVFIDANNKALVTVSTDVSKPYEFKIEADDLVPVDLIPVFDEGKEPVEDTYYVTNAGASFYVPKGTAVKIGCEAEGLSYEGTVNADTVVPTFVMPKSTTFCGQVFFGQISVPLKYTTPETNEELSFGELYYVINGDVANKEVADAKWDYSDATGWMYSFDYTYKGNEVITVMATSGVASSFAFDNIEAAVDPATGLVDNLYVKEADVPLSFNITDFVAGSTNDAKTAVSAIPIVGMKVTMALYAVYGTANPVWERIGTICEDVTDIEGLALLNAGAIPDGLRKAFGEGVTLKVAIETEDVYITDYGIYTFESNLGDTEKNAPSAVKKVAQYNKDETGFGGYVCVNGNALRSNEKTIGGIYTIDGSTLSGFQMTYVIMPDVKDGSSSPVDVGVATIIGPAFFMNIPGNYIGGAYKIYTSADKDRFVVDGNTTIDLSSLSMPITGVQYKAKSTAPILTYGLNINIESLINTFSNEKGLVRQIEEVVGAVTTFFNAIPEYISANMYKVTVNGLPYNPVDSKDDIKIGDKVNVGVTQKSFKMLLRDIEMGGSIEFKINDVPIKLKDLFLKLGDDYADYAFVINLDALRYVDHDGVSRNIDMNDSTTFDLTGNTTIYGAVSIGYELASPTEPAADNSVDPSLIAIGIAAIIVALIAFVYVIVTQRRQ